MKIVPMVMIFCEDADGKILLGRRSNSVLAWGSDRLGWGGLWMPPSGLQDPGETIMQAAKRILQENCGIEASILHQQGVADYIHVEEKVHHLNINFLCTAWKGRPYVQEYESIDLWAWFSIHNFPKVTPPTEQWLQSRTM